MNKTKRILLSVFCILLVLLLVSLFIAVGVSVAKNGVQGLVGELLGNHGFFTGTDAEQWESDFGTQAPDGMTEEPVMQNEESAPVEEPFDYKTLFDFDMQHKPTYEDYLKIQDGMTVEQAVAILGKPHDLDAAAGSKYLTWELADGGSCWIKAVSLYATENPTDWSEILQPHYGGAIVAYHNYSGPGAEQDGK